jgi:hypothetical protein
MSVPFTSLRRRTRIVATAGALALGLGLAQAAQADTLTVARDYDNYTMGFSESGHTGGGEFAVTQINGLTALSMASGAGISGSVFQTFCLERNEVLSPGTYNWSLGTAAHAGGVGGATNGSDPISAATAVLFTRFWNGTLTNYAGHSYNYTAGSGRVASAAELQDAIWYLEGELTDSQIDHNSTAWAWAQQALTDAGNSTSIGNVRVLTLTDSSGGNHQDVLVLIPLPPAAMLGLGLLSAIGVAGVIRRRRTQALV